MNLEICHKKTEKDGASICEKVPLTNFPSVHSLGYYVDDSKICCVHKDYENTTFKCSKYNSGCKNIDQLNNDSDKFTYKIDGKS